MSRAAARILALPAALMALAGCSVLPDRSPTPRQDRVSSAQPTFSRAPATGQCLKSLGVTEARFDALPDQYYGGGCSTVGTVKLASLRSDAATIALANMGPVTCTVAETFAGWARYGVDRAARQVLGSPIARIETMGSYSCRKVAGSDRMSAHSTGDAIDVAAFLLEDGRRISVLDDWSRGTPQEREFLRLVHQSACKRFGTVLGPDYNRAHENHFHVEKVIAGKSYCR
ncbi:extensin family protein [Tsuneonella sp. HG222]